LCRHSPRPEYRPHGDKVSDAERAKAAAEERVKLEDETRERIKGKEELSEKLLKEEYELYERARGCIIDLIAERAAHGSVNLLRGCEAPCMADFLNKTSQNHPVR
jgi:predicted glycosyl hydrolase (DUF1957 family)